MHRNADSTESWHRTESIILGIGQLPESEVDAYLKRSCGEDDWLRERIWRLLTCADEPSGPLSAAVATHAVSLLDTDPTAWATEDDSTSCSEIGPPDRIGAFRLLDQLGAGGSSTVYLAERADDLYQQRVAIKVLSHGLWSGRLQRRFAAERQILARLDHPNIARLLDGGITSMGSPYFVMELVDGEPIDLYCDQRHLLLEARLELFKAICATVHFAHTCQIVHRDIKPSNVYVTSLGVPKLLDFGIAKLLREEGEAEGSATGMPAPMTPRYASPEQLKGLRVTTASDVYSLGLLLYLLLTGRKPFGEQISPAALWQLRARGEAPDHPSSTVRDGSGTAEAAASRGLRPSELRRRLSGDLDHIVAMALDESPERRYASAAQLAEDVERHLTHRPVKARRDQFGYRQRRFIRRHLWAVGMGSLVAALLIGAVVTLFHQSTQIAAERDRANQVSQLLTDLFETAEQDADRGSQITARELLDRGAGKIVDLPPKPETAVLMSTIARLYSRLGVADRAIPLFESALDIQRKSAGPRSAVVAKTLNALAIERVAQGDYARAAKAFHQVLGIRRERLGVEHPKTLDSFNNLALIHHDLGHYRRARKLYRQAIASELRIFGPEHQSSTQSNLALLHFDQGDYRQAGELYAKVLKQLEAGFGHDPTETAEPLQMLALVASELGEYDEATKLARRAFDLNRRVYGDLHPELIRSRDAVGAVHLVRGDLAEAEKFLRQALDIRRTRLGALHADTGWSLERWADLQVALGKSAAAKSSYREAITAYWHSFPKGHPLTARAETSLGALLADLGHCQGAAELLRSAEHIRLRELAAGAWPVFETRGALALCAADLTSLRSAHRVLAANLGDEHRRTRRLARWIDRLAAHSSSQSADH